MRDLGKGIGLPADAAVNRSGTSIVLLTSKRWLTVVRRGAGGEKFRVSARTSVRGFRYEGRLVALPDDHFLLVYDASGRRLIARDISPSGRFDTPPHVLSTDDPLTGGLDVFPLGVTVDADGARTVVLWGSGTKVTQVVGAVDGPAGWSSSQVIFSVENSAQDVYVIQLVHDDHDRFLLSLRGENGPPALMWGLPAGSQQWQDVTPPQAADDSPLAEQIGATVGSLNGTITAAWQDASAAVVLSTWDGSAWTSPVTAIAGKTVGGNQVPVFPLFVSGGQQAAIVWAADDDGALSRIDATIRTSPGGTWSAPLVFPHSRAVGSLVIGGDIPLDDFWFTSSGALAGAWTGDPVTASSNPNRRGLYFGQMSTSGATSTAISRAWPDTTNHIWNARPRSGGRYTITWADEKNHEYATTTDGHVASTQPLPACGLLGGGASNAEAGSEVLIFGPGSPGTKCQPSLVWSG